MALGPGNVQAGTANFGVYSTGNTSGIRIYDNVIGKLNTAIQLDAGGNASNNLIRGNVIGLSGTSLNSGSPVSTGISVQNASATIGGTVASQKNVIAACTGTSISVSDAGGTVVVGNWIGTDPQKMYGFSGGIGIAMTGSQGSIIGGTTAASGNLIYGKTTGILLESVGSISVQGNSIGKFGSGFSVGTGIRVSDADHVTIGGDVTAAGNVIDYATKGIVATSDVDYLDIRRNAMGNNVSGLAIDLNDNGATANDAGDTDTGANGLQNFPLLFSANATSGTQTVVQGVINSSAATPMRIDFYAGDIGGNKGKAWLGETYVITDAAGGATISATLPWVSSTQSIVATATSLLAAPAGRTSELSAAVNVVGPVDALPPQLTGSHLDIYTGKNVVVEFNESIDPATVSAGDLLATNLTTGQTLAPVSFSQLDGNQLSFAFAGTLPDGNYNWTIATGAIADTYGNTTEGPISDNFYVLAGDSNRDRTVNFADLLTLAANYGQSNMAFTQGDFDYNGSVGFSDLLILAARYNTSVPAAAIDLAAPASIFSSRPIDNNDDMLA
ncbi:MAG: Ig-like domain-containing protein [Tepidisphaeraceae bacterium]